MKLKDDKPRTEPREPCPECNGAGAVEVREPIIWGELVHKVKPCKRCGGTGRVPAPVRLDADGESE